MNEIDIIFLNLKPQDKEKLLHSLNSKREAIIEYVAGKFIGVHVTASHVNTTMQINSWSIGEIKA